MVKKSSTEDWQAALAASTGQWAFVLTLSRRMIDALHIVRDCPNQLWLGSAYTTPMLSLVRRGLIAFRLASLKDTPSHLAILNRYELTPAGESVVKLLEYAKVLPTEKYTIPVQQQERAERLKSKLDKATA